MITSLSKPVTEVLHGVTVVDPYRWLENRSLPETQGWLNEQRQYYENYFAHLAGMESLRARVHELLDVEIVEQPAKAGSYYFFRRRQKGEEQACLWVRDVVTGSERLLVDPSGQGPFVAVAIFRIADDGRALAFALKHGGERPEELHFVDVATGNIWEDYLPAGQSRGLEFASDSTGYYYCHDVIVNNSASHAHEIRYHEFGGSFDRDVLLFSCPRSTNSSVILSADAANLGAIYSRETSSGPKVDFYVASRENDRLWRTIFANRPYPYGTLLHHGRYYAMSLANNSHGQVIELGDDGSEGAVVIPAGDIPMSGLIPTADSLYASYDVDCSTTVHRWSWTGVDLGPLPEQPQGSFGMLPNYSNNSEALFFLHESFSQPPAILEYEETSHSYRRWPLQPPPISEGYQYGVQRIAYPSKDGTAIPMWLVNSDGIRPVSPRPAIMTGYGAAGFSMTPRFSFLVTIMLEFGCVFALPNIRGGGEFGNEWHEAACRSKRQVVYDDFLAAAEWLCDQGISTPEQLAIFGGSNSGLLVAVAMTQKPDLFRAVLCIAPLLDMLRYERFGDAAKWVSEHGTVDDADEFHALYKYSPYHRILDQQDYPATFFVTGDKDGQCDPAHVRKMAARLQDRDAQSHPILVDYSAERGHTASLPLSVRVEALTRRIAFFCNELGIDLRSGAAE
jgi:prolyl oligopeptidase